MEDQDDITMTEELNLSNQITTIDPSVVQSRIRMSASLAKDEMQQDDGEETQDQQPIFPKLSALKAGGGRIEYRRIRCPPHRYTPLRESWEQILTPLVEYLKLQASKIIS
jgi:hypothetical protein